MGKKSFGKIVVGSHRPVVLWMRMGLGFVRALLPPPITARGLPPEAPALLLQALPSVSSPALSFALT